MPHGKFASSNQKHHLDLRLFTVPYFSVKPSRSSAMHYVWPSLVSYELMGGHQSLFSRWRKMSHPPPPQVHLTLITRLDSVHMKPRLLPMMQSTQSHRKNRVPTVWKVYLDLGSVVSSVGNFWTSFSDVASGRNQWWHCEMLAVFSGYLHMCIKRINFQHITCNYNIYR